MSRADQGKIDFDDFGKDQSELEAKYAETGQHPEFTIDEHRNAMALNPELEGQYNGYWDWVVAQISKDDDEIPSTITADNTPAEPAAPLLTARRPHELRVIAEKTELDIRLFALEQFLGTDNWNRMSIEDQVLLASQKDIMASYSKVLGQRIDRFPPLVSGDNPGPRGHEKSFPIAAPVAAQPIEDLDGFAMMVDQWHGKCMEQGNRMLNIPEGTTIQVADMKKPGELVEMDLNGAYLQTYRIGAEAVLQIFKDLPFGVSLEDAPEGEPEFIDGVNQDDSSAS